MKKALILFVVVLGLAIAGSAQTGAATTAAAKPKFTEAQQKVLLNLSLAKLGLAICQMSPTGDECKKEDYDRMFSEAMAKAVADPAIAYHLLTQAVGSYEGMKGQTRSAVQVSQIVDQQNVELTRLMVAQNQRIIELLELLVKKK